MKLQSNPLRSVLILLASVIFTDPCLEANPQLTSNGEGISDQKFYKSLIKCSLAKERGELLLKGIEQISNFEGIFADSIGKRIPKTEIEEQAEHLLASILHLLSLLEDEKYSIFKASEDDSSQIRQALLNYKSKIHSYLKNKSSISPKSVFESEFALAGALRPLRKHLLDCNPFSTSTLKTLQESLDFESSKAFVLMNKTVSFHKKDYFQKPDKLNFDQIEIDIRFIRHLLETDQFEESFISLMNDCIFQKKNVDQFKEKIEQLKTRYMNRKSVRNAIRDAEQEGFLTFVGEEGKQLIHIYNEEKPYSGYIQSKYENGQVKKLLTVDQGRVSGPTIMWYENGRVKGRVHWRNGKPDGSMISWDQEGKLLQEGFWEDGEVKWTANDWDAEGQAINRSMIYNSPHLNQASKQTLLEKSKTDDFFQDWIKEHQAGQIKRHYAILQGFSSEKIDLNNIEIRNNTFKSAINPNELESREQNGEKIAYQNNIPFNGWIKVFQPNIFGLAQVKDGVLNGIAEGFYPSGRKHISEIWKNGRILSAISWKPNGEVCLITGIKEGKGVTLIYDEDGNIFDRTFYHNGKQVFDKE